MSTTRKVLFYIVCILTLILIGVSGVPEKTMSHGETL